MMSGACYLCKNGNFETIAGRLRYGEPKTVKRCTSCGVIFIDPPMSKEEEEKFYQEEYGRIFAKEKDTTPEGLFNIRNPEAVSYYNLVKPYLDKKDMCLELGCASGYFLHYIKDKVASIAGYEPFLSFRRWCESLGIPMVDDLQKLHDDSYDKIFMFFLLEHLNDPLPFLKNVKRLIRPGGVLLMIVPNADDALLNVYDIPSFRDFYFTAAHPFYYSKATLSLLLKKAGLTDFDIFPEQRYDLSNHINWMTEGRPGGQGKYGGIFREDTLRAYAEDLKRQFKCDTLFAVARKS